MDTLSKRQAHILEFIRNSEQAGNKEIREHVKERFGDISRVTIVRDIDVLLENKLIEKIGKGRSVYYKEAGGDALLRYIDAEDYFKKGPDERQIAFRKFNPSVFEELRKGVFTDDELLELRRINKTYLSRIKKLTGTALKKEIERLTIELSWKSSQIEGNTYSLIDTEILIKEHKEARGRKKEEAIMILNHKKTLDYIFSNQSHFKTMTIRKIEGLHHLLTQDLSISKGLRKKAVGIVGTAYRPLDNEHQVREAIEKTTALINDFPDSFSKALAAILLISYIQPFEDGNKRTSRLLGDAILLAHDVCPLSYRSIDEADYKKAIILFYEQNNARFFKELFIQQYKFAVENYFLS